ncbi:hypothetical protein FAI40_03415 [Acetobacteraceae bacterium]|nr:hypothetical protein FAI40_03415 [Acetobacteraceae bacterium]
MPLRKKTELVSDQKRPPRTTPPPHKHTLWQHFWHGDWGYFNWIFFGSLILLSLILAYPIFIK